LRKKTEKKCAPQKNPEKNAKKFRLRRENSLKFRGNSGEKFRLLGPRQNPSKFRGNSGAPDFFQNPLHFLYKI